jgi:tripartite motif-containing protein 2/3/tripartite motif-containing protein 71
VVVSSASPSSAEPRLALVSDFSNHRVQAMSWPSLVPVWQYGSLAAGGTDAVGSLHHPSYCAFSRDSSLVFVADTVNHRLVTLAAADGAFVAAHGREGTAAHGEFQYPTGVAVSPATGRVWVTDYSNHRVVCLDMQSGTQSSSSSVGSPRTVCQLGVTEDEGDEMQQFSRPTGIAVADGLVFVADFGNSRVQVRDVCDFWWRSPISSAMVWLILY